MLYSSRSHSTALHCLSFFLGDKQCAILCSVQHPVTARLFVLNNWYSSLIVFQGPEGPACQASVGTGVGGDTVRHGQQVIQGRLPPTPMGGCLKAAGTTCMGGGGGGHCTVSRSSNVNSLLEGNYLLLE